MKLVTVVGARPQFIKMGPVSKILRTRALEVLVHTGQHFDHNMSDIFFKEMRLPEPSYNLDINGGSHGQMTGRMLLAIERVLLREAPDMLLVYGDTNSTLAAALAAVKQLIPVCHVESGGRLGTLSNPEEVNRICTDHVSSLLLACVESAVQFLIKENLGERTRLVGDPMYDAFLHYRRLQGNAHNQTLRGINDEDIVLPSDFYYLTCHRQENTFSDEPLTEILGAMNSLDAPTIYPVHPRNMERVIRIREKHRFENVLLAKPVGYLSSIGLVSAAKKIVTDSGGVQREAFFASKQCVTIFDYVAWPETMVANRNQLSSPNKDDIIDKLSKKQTVDPSYQPFGDGHASEKIVEEITRFLNNTH